MDGQTPQNLSSQSIVPQSSNKPRSKRIYLVIGIILLVIFASLGYLFRKDTIVKNNVAVSPSPAAKPTIKADETADWKTYSNIKYGYSLKYPSDWTITDGQTDENVTFAGKGEGRGEGYKPPLVSVSIFDTIKFKKEEAIQNGFDYKIIEKNDKTFLFLASTYLIG